MKGQGKQILDAKTILMVPLLQRVNSIFNILINEFSF